MGAGFWKYAIMVYYWVALGSWLYNLGNIGIIYKILEDHAQEKKGQTT